MTTLQMSAPVGRDTDFRFKDIEYRHADIEKIDVDEGTVLMRAAPYDHEVQLARRVWESFAPAAFARAAVAPHRVKLWHEHGGPLIGKAIDVEDRPDGIWIRSKFSSTVAAQEARELSRDGTLDQCSVTFKPLFDWIKRTDKADGAHYRHARGYLLGVALVAHGAYGEEAFLAEARAADPDLAIVEREKDLRRQRILAWTH